MVLNNHTVIDTVYSDSLKPVFQIKLPSEASWKRVQDMQLCQVDRFLGKKKMIWESVWWFT